MAAFSPLTMKLFILATAVVVVLTVSAFSPLLLGNQLGQGQISGTAGLVGNANTDGQLHAGSQSVTNIPMASAAYFPVTFTESGLPSGSTWNVTLHGVTLSGSAGSAITFSEPNGTYAYTLTGPYGYQLVSPGATGTVTVAGSPDTVVVSSIAVGSAPRGITYDASNGYLYVTNAGSNNVTVINGATDTVVVSSIAVGAFSTGIAYDPSNGYLYVVNANSNNVTVINGATNTVVVRSITVGNGPIGIAYDTSNGYLYVANYYSNNVTVINGATNTVVVSGIAVGTYPIGIAYDASNGYLYVANVGSNNVTVINGATNTVVVPSIAVGSEPYDIAYDTSNGYLYVVNYGSYNVTVINGATNTVVVRSITAGNEPIGIAYDASNGYLYVTNYNSNNVTAINGNGLLVTAWKASPLYAVTFTETGLPSGTEWWVNVTGRPSQFSTGTTITVNLVNGSYTYSISTANKTYHAAGGTFPVNGAADSESVTFSPVTYSVTFTETGLPSGTEWWVNVTNGSSFYCTVSTLTFSEPNGTYSYSVATANKSWSSNGGSVTVNGASVSQSLTFTSVTYTVTLTETGLPSGTSWPVTLNGVTKTSTGSSISFTEPNGTYAYTVSTPISGVAGVRYVTASSGSVTVNSNNPAVSVPYVPQYYLATYSSPSAGGTTSPLSGWYNADSTVTISATLVSGYAFISWTGTGTGSYTGTSASHTITMGTPITEIANFDKLYAITFTESGLPSGTEWFVNQTNGQSFNSTSTIITFNEPNGTYAYSIATANKEYSDPVGSFTVSGASVSMPVTFSLVTYAITFIESGLSSGTNWSVTLAGLTKYSTSATITFNEPDGTYAYSVSNTSYYYTSSHSGTIAVSGAAQSENIAYQYYSYITGTVTPSSAVITINGNPVTVTSGNFNVTVTAGTYALVASSPGYTTHYSNFTLSAGQTHTLTITLHIRSSVSTSPAKSSPPTYLYIGIGAAAVIALIAAAVIVSRKRKQT